MSLASILLWPWLETRMTLGGLAVKLNKCFVFQIELGDYSMHVPNLAPSSQICFVEVDNLVGPKTVNDRNKLKVVYMLIFCTKFETSLIKIEWSKFNIYVGM